MKEPEAVSELTTTMVEPSYSKKSIRYRKWLTFSFLSLTIMGPIYSYAFLQPLQLQIENHFVITDTQYNLLYTLGGIPTLFMPFVGGYLTDYFGARTILLATLLITIISQMLMAYSCQISNFYLLIVGSLIYNSVYDTFYLSRVKLIMIMFYDEGMSMAAGIAVVTQKLIMFACNIVTPWVYYNTNSLEAAWWYLPVTISILAFVLGLIFVFFDKQYKLTDKVVSTDEQSDDSKRMKWSDLKKLNKLVWLFILTGAFCYSGYIGVLDNLNALLQRRYNFDTQQAGNTASSYTIVSMIMTPLVSWGVEKTQKKMYCIIIYAICINLVFFTFLILPTCDQCYISLVPLSLIGCFAAFFLLANSSVMAFLVQKNLIGTALGIRSSIVNTLGVLSPYLFGVILDSTKEDGQYDYTWIFVVLQGISAVGLGITLIMSYINVKMGRPLDAKTPDENQRIWIY